VLNVHSEEFDGLESMEFSIKNEGGGFQHLLYAEDGT